jgi:cytochrome c peroxidase
VKAAALALLAAALLAPADRSPSGAGSVAGYVPPAAGSYRLPVIQRVSDHPLLEGDGRRTTLFDLKGHRLAVVAFIYTACTDAGGCPLSQATLLSIDRALAADRALRGEATLITLSFDPERDTPQRLARTRELYAPRSDWHFATPPQQALQALLEDFGQPVARLRLDDATWSGLYRHVLKVFLLDREDGVRNIYSTGFLDRDLVLNDLRTLAAGG